MPYVGVRWYSLVFTFLRVEYKMMGEYVTLIGLGFLIGMIVGMGLM
jgi:hypothetical protein